MWVSGVLNDQNQYNCFVITFDFWLIWVYFHHLLAQLLSNYNGNPSEPSL